MGNCSTAVTELNPGIFQIRGLGGSSHSYVIKGDYMNVMIDSGSDQNFPVLERGLRHIGIKVRDVNLVINSHEHCDHIGANRYFQDCAMIAAYRLAASKIITGDYYVTMYKGNDLNEIPLRAYTCGSKTGRASIWAITACVCFTRPVIRPVASRSSRRDAACSFPLTACSPAARSPISPSREASATIWIRSPGCVVSVCARSIQGKAGSRRRRSKTSIKRLPMPRNCSTSGVKPAPRFSIKRARTVNRQCGCSRNRLG